MDLKTLYFQRYDVLCNFYIDGIWSKVPQPILCERPGPRLNSIAWNLWHIARVEDAGLNRFVADRPQVLDEGGWMERMNLPWRHAGTDMTFPEVDELNARINVGALRDYSLSVQARTREIVNGLGMQDLDAPVEAERARRITFDEGLAHSNPEGLAANYTGWTKGKCLLHFGLTHSFQHIGEIDVLVSLHGLEW